MEPEWPAAEVIVGNPPFLGDKRMRGELGDKYVESLFKLYENRISAFADLGMHIGLKKRGPKYRSARLSVVGSIGHQLYTPRYQSKSPRTDQRSLETYFMAWSDRPWILDGAAVRVSMMGFDDGAGTESYR